MSAPVDPSHCTDCWQAGGLAGHCGAGDEARQLRGPHPQEGGGGCRVLALGAPDLPGAPCDGPHGLARLCPGATCASAPGACCRAAPGACGCPSASPPSQSSFRRQRLACHAVPDGRHIVPIARSRGAPIREGAMISGPASREPRLHGSRETGRSPCGAGCGETTVRVWATSGTALPLCFVPCSPAPVVWSTFGTAFPLCALCPAPWPLLCDPGGRPRAEGAGGVHH